MRGYGPEILDEIRSRIDILDIVSEKVTLKRAGANHKGLCPFHSEKTPSFSVNPARGLFKCFGCGEGGDIFSFVMKTDGLSFPEAVRHLAGRAGVDLPSSRDDSSPVREAVLSLNEAAAEFFHENLLSNHGNAARRHLAGRGLDRGAIKRFSIGLAPEGWSGLFNRMRKRYGEEAIEASGLFIHGAKGWYDRFRERITFPIRNASGKVVGFGGRILPEKTDGPKYINTPETELFRKNAVLYGVDLARRYIREKNEAICVEGYTDVILLHAAGFTNTVASMGTALTENQIEMIRRYASGVVLAYDPDSAGEAATERGIEISLEKGLSVRIAVMPEGLDPADAVMRFGPERVGETILAAEDYIDYRMKRIIEGRDLGDPGKRIEAARKIIPTLKRISDPIVKSVRIHAVSERLGIDEATIRAETERREVRETAGWESPAPSPAGPERMLLRLIIEFPEIRRETEKEILKGDFGDEALGRIYTAVISASSMGEPLTGSLGGRLEGSELELFSEIALMDFNPDDPGKMGRDLVGTIGKRRIDREIARLSSSSAGESEEEERRIFERYANLIAEQREKNTVARGGANGETEE